MPHRTITIKIWDALNSEEEYAEAIEIKWYDEVSALDERSFALCAAVTEWVEKNWPDSDYPETMGVRVRTPDGRLLEITVRAEQDVTFRATPKQPVKL